MRGLNRPLVFLLFFVSGFCGLLYQVVWTRLAFASFGIITPVLSVVISVFMLGLSLGAWAAGRSIGALVRRTGLSAAMYYALAELVIGVGAFAVPMLFGVGEHCLLGMGESGSVRYLVFSALGGVGRGATFPFMMAYVREQEPRNSESFSYLYLANVLGATSGTLVTAIVLVEALGFRHTLWVAAAGNFIIAAISVWLGVRSPQSKVQSLGAEVKSPKSEASPQSEMAGAGGLPGKGRGRLIQWLLFSTGV